MKLFAKIAMAVSAVVFLAGASLMAQTASIDYDHTVNFLKYKTYTWAKVQATDSGVESRITIALNRDMGGRYMTEVPKNGDVTITAVETSKDQADYETFYDSLGDWTWQRGWGSAGFMDSQAGIADIPLNTLVIDMYDTKSHKLLWRGMIAAPLEGSVDKMANTIDKAVTELIGKYPPKYKK
jgi:hypothetical protein